VGAPPHPRVPVLGVPATGPSWVALAVLSAVVALAVHPLAVVPAALLGLAARRWPVAGRLVPLVVIAVAGAGVAAAQLRHSPALTSRWPSRFGAAHVACLLAVVVLAGLALAEARREADAPADDGSVGR